MDYLKNIIKNSLFQSIVFGGLLTLIFILIWDAPIKKFKVEIEPFSHKSNDGVYWFAGDYDGDGNSERFRCFQKTNSNSMDLVFYDKNGNLQDHYHLGTYEWNYQLKPGIYDIDNDGLKELLFFTLHNDSIFFNAFSLNDFTFKIKDYYFSSFEKQSENYACTSYFHEFGDFNGDGINELFIRFDAGFGLYPRGIFKMEFPSLNITASQSDYMLLGFMSFKDLNQDGIPEILTWCSAPDNSSYTSGIKYYDTLSYIAVLDYDLNFLFEPIPIGDAYSSVQSIASTRNDSLFYCMYYSRSNHTEPFKLMVLTKNGKIINEKRWTNISNPEDLLRGLKLINGIPYLFLHDIGKFELTPSLEFLPNNFTPEQNHPNSTPLILDLNNDGYDEWMYENRKNEIYIYNENTEDEYVLDSPLPVKPGFKIFPIIYKSKLIKYMIDTGSGYFFFRYYKNKHFLLLYLIYAFTFLFTSTIIYFILYFQKKNIEKKWHTQQELSELQFNSVKNQLNPHFLFNSLNSVAYLINEGKKNEAYDFLTLNARMIQRVMDDAQDVKRSLKDEIQFTKDYLKIQQHRFKDRFSFQFNIHQNTDLKFEVPKMCIHTYVENAVKHGFRNTKRNGLLLIDISPLKNGVFISICDNGMGRKAASGFKDSTGNGLNIMQEFYRLFEKYHDYKINYKIFDLDDNSTGTRIELQFIKD